MKIGVIEGSIREGRTAATVTDWVMERTQEHVAGIEDVEVERIVLADFDVPLLTSATVPGAANGQYDDERVSAWGRAIAACDAFVFVTPEYNHSVPGAFKNAFDSLGAEWRDKAVAFVGYGAAGGVRAVEHWRSAVANFNMTDVRTQLDVNLFTEFDADGLAPRERRAEEFTGLMEQLIIAARRIAAV